MLSSIGTAMVSPFTESSATACAFCFGKVAFAKFQTFFIWKNSSLTCAYPPAESDTLEGASDENDGDTVPVTPPLTPTKPMYPMPKPADKVMSMSAEPLQ